MEELFDPVGTYRDQLKGECERVAAETFRKLVDQSGVDAAANHHVVSRVRRLERLLESLRRHSGWLKFWIALVIIACLAGGGYCYYGLPRHYHGENLLLYQISGIALAVILAIGAVVPLWKNHRETGRKISQAEETVSELKQQGWQQLEALNRLFTWQTVTDIIHEVLPLLNFDPYFSNGRLNQLRRQYGWSDDFNNDRSIESCQSGSINGNPFVLANALTTTMGTATYTGHLTIHWTERESYVDSKGNLRSRTVHRTQVLTATVVKPAPYYYYKRFLIFGSEAAPELSFSRRPTDLSELGNGWFARRRMKAAIRKLKAESLENGSFMMMSNEQFDAMFNALDRNNETQFRLLFTPVAQRQMMALLRDRKVGYGDDFCYTKSRKISLLMPEHLQALKVDADPDYFRSWNLDGMEKFFNAYVNDYFRALYFALAPILSIPLFQQYQSDAEIYKDVYDWRGSFWEYESMANSYDVSEFKHPQCITNSILKITGAHPQEDGSTELAVTAYGYRGVERVDYVSTCGGDGRCHNVPVHWIEYIPVEATSPLIVRESIEEQPSGDGGGQGNAAAEAWREFFTRWGGSQEAGRRIRRFIYAFRK